MNEAAETGSHFLTLAVLVFYWVLLSLWPEIWADTVKEASEKEAQAVASAPPARLQQAPAVALAFDAIRRLDRFFDETEFVRMACAAYEVILRAYANGDAKALASFLSTEVADAFAAATDARGSLRETLELTFVGMKQARVIAAEISGETALITVSFSAEIISAVRSHTGEIVSGDPGEIVDTNDLWTFSRKVTSTDPVWRLMATDEA